MAPSKALSPGTPEVTNAWKQELVGVVRLHGLKPLKEAVLAYALGCSHATISSTGDLLSTVWLDLRKWLPPDVPAALELLAKQGLTLASPNAIWTEFDRRLVLPRLRRLLSGLLSNKQSPLVIYGPFTALAEYLGNPTIPAGNAAAACIARVLLEHMVASGAVPRAIDLIDGNPYPSLSTTAIGICCQGSAELRGRGRRRKKKGFPVYNWMEFLSAMMKGETQGLPPVAPSDWTGAKRLLLFGTARQKSKKLNSSDAARRMAEPHVLDPSSELTPQLYRVAYWLESSDVLHSILLVPELVKKVRGPQRGAEEERLRDLIDLRAAYLLNPYSPSAAGEFLDSLRSWPHAILQKMYSVVLDETLAHFNEGLLVLTRMASAGTLLFNHWLQASCRDPQVRLRPAFELTGDAFASLAECYWKDSGQKNLHDALNNGHVAQFNERSRTSVYMLYTDSPEAYPSRRKTRAQPRS